MFLGKKHLVGLLIGTFLFTACGGGGGGTPSPPAGTVVSKTASLTGGEEVPPVATSASGSGLLEVNTGTGAASGQLTIGTAPTSTVIAAHVQEAARGTNGSIVIVLENSGSGTWGVPSGTLLSSAQVTAFSAGELYFNVHTATYPNGEIRGQIDGAATPAAGRLR